MNINASISALQSISADFNLLPARINQAFSNTDSGTESKEGLENVLVDMKMGERAFAANVKVLQTMNAVENILLDDLRKQE